MAAIGDGWVDGAWVETGWVVGAWATLASVLAFLRPLRASESIKANVVTGSRFYFRLETALGQIYPRVRRRRRT